MAAAHPWVLVSGDFTPLGGMDRANHGLASYLARQPGADVHLVTHRAWADLKASPAVTVHPARRPWGKHWLGEPLLDRAGRAVATELQPRGARVVVNGGNCGWADVNWVHYVHAAFTPRQDGPLRRRLKSAAFHRWALATERRSIGAAGVVVANSNRTRDHVIEHLRVPPERVRTVYYGTDPAQFRPGSADERAASRQKLSWTNDRPTVAFVGALGDLRKGLDTLFRAWRRLAARPGWDARLAVVGAGPSLERWKAEAADLSGSVEFLGFRDDIPDVLRACDLLVSPTRYEAYGLNVHEALCCGIPAIVSAGAGVAERFPELMHDLLLPDPEDDADLADRLSRWRDRATDHAASASALGDSLRRHTWDDMARQFVDAVEGAAPPA